MTQFWVFIALLAGIGSGFRVLPALKRTLSSPKVTQVVEVAAIIACASPLLFLLWYIAGDIAQ